MEQNLTLGLSIKIISDIIGLTSFSEAEGEKFYESNKKNIQRMKDFDINGMTEKDFLKYEDFIKKINNWSEWAIQHKYLHGYQQTAMTNFFLILFEAACYNMPLNKNMVEHFFSYALAKVIHLQVKEYMSYNPNDDKYNALYWTLNQFDFFGIDDDYKKDISPIAGSFNILKGFVKDINNVIDFWEDKISELGKRDCPPNLNSYLLKWSKGVTPSWKIIKLFFDNDLCIPEEYFVDDEDIKNNCYKAFKANLFIAFVLTNLFESLEKQEIITKETRTMIRIGTRMYFRDFYVKRDKNNKDYSSEFEAGAKENLMFRTLFWMLDGGYGDCSTLDYLESAYQHSEIPIILG